MEDPIQINQPAPPFNLPVSEQETLTLDELHDANGTLLVFVYGTYCATCMQTYSNLARTHAQFIERDVRLVVISLDSWNQSVVFKTTMRHPINFAILSDESGEVHKKYGCYDHSFGAFYLTQDGVVRARLRQNTFPGVNRLLRMIDEGEAAA